MSSSAPRPLAEGSRWSSLTRWLPAALCFFVTLVAVGPLFADGGFLITRGIGDSPNLLFRVHQWLAAFTSGQFPPRWMPDAAYGYGLPYFTYYASFSTQVAALLKLYGFSYVLAIKLAQALALLTGAVGLYGWLRGSGADQPAAGLAAAAYTFAPFHLVNVYIRGDSLAELWAMGLFPVLLWAAQRVLAQPAPGRAFALAAAVATLVCTHNISALNFLPFLGIYVILGGAGRGWRPLGVSLAALAWGLALSAFFWLPALREGGFVQLGDLTQGYFFYGNHFRDADLLQATPLFDYTSTPFSLGLAQTLAAAAGALALLVRAWRRRRWAWSDLFLLGGLAVATLMITPWSRPVWEAVPLLGYTQFPWRFLSIQAVFTAALTGALVDGEGTPRPGWHWPAALALAALLALAGLGGLRLQFVPLADTEVTAERLNLYEYFTTAVGNTVNAEYLPAAVVPRPFTSETLLGRPPGLKALTGTAEGERLSRAGARETWRVSVAGDQPAAVAVPTYWWPGWLAEVDGQPAATRAADGLGWIVVDVPPGTHTLTVWLGWTPLRAGAEVFSAAALVLPLAVFALRRRWRWPRVSGRALGWVATVLGVAALGSLALSSLPAAASTAPLNADFDLLAYPHRDGVRFADGTRLTRAEPESAHLARGGTVTLSTEWELTRPVTATFALRLPPPSLAEPLATTRVAFAPDADGRARAAVTLPVSAQLRPGVYFVSVEVQGEGGGEPAVTAQGQRRGLVYLAPLVIDDETALASPGHAAAPDLGATLRVLTAQTTVEAAVRVDVTWQALADLTRNYQVALRLTDAAGLEWGRGGDVQPGAGFYPTALWRPGEVVTDQYRLPWGGLGEPPGVYTTTVTVYAVDTLQPLGEFNVAAMFDRRYPRAGHTAQFELTPDLALEKVEAPAEAAQGQTLDLRVHWLTGAAPPADFHARWSLTDSAGARFTQVLALAPGSPANTWPAEAWLVGRAALRLPADLAPGQYTLALQLLAEADRGLGPEVAVGAVTVTGRERVFNVPALPTALAATFDGQLQLWGYAAEQTSAALELTLAWGALAAPRGDYKYFVHVFNPADDVIVTQADAMPRAFTYPTSQWAAGEVVTDTVTLSLAEVPPGQYGVAVGWYNPAAPDLARLPALDAQGAPLPLDRVLLPLTVSVGD